MFYKVRVNEIPKEATENPVIFDSYVKAQSVLRQHEKPYCSISGGSDSDIMLDILTHLDVDGVIQYAWYNTGLEYAATKRHLDYLEERYGVKINRVNAVKSVPLCVKEYGVPLVNKNVSKCIFYLQRHEFQWEDESYEILAEKYPRCIASIKWWTNMYKGMQAISYNKYLKEFLMQSSPNFPVSFKCCEYAKKKTAHNDIKASGCDVDITGMRQAEGGIRKIVIQNCYTIKENGVDSYRPLFWYSDKDKAEYKELFNIRNSDCYEIWGFKRTGCVGCPYNKFLFDDLGKIEQYEPNLYKACQRVFGQAYEWTAKYKEFQKEFQRESKIRDVD